MSFRIRANPRERVRFVLLPVRPPSGDGGGEAAPPEELAFRFKDDLNVSVRSAVGELERPAIAAAKNPTGSPAPRFAFVVLRRGSFRAVEVAADSVQPDARERDVADGVGELTPPPPDGEAPEAGLGGAAAGADPDNV